MAVSILTWLGAALSTFLLFITLLPVIKTGNWVARVCDFPRLQILVSSVLPISLIGAAGLVDGLSPVRTAVLCAAVAVAGWQLSHIVRYTRYWPCEVSKDPVGEATISVLIVNLDYQNQDKMRTLSTLQSNPVDLLLLIEIDMTWESALTPVLGDYSHREGVVRGDGLGLLLVSKLPLNESETRHLVSDDRASIHAAVEVKGERVRVIALHPTPPGLKAKGGERHDSRIRDAELVLVAEEIRKAESIHCIVLGDLNDVAWSHTTRLFRRLSGLCDPRIGRKLLSTYHARRPLFRYPLDHVFVSNELSVSRLERVRVPGSDHFGVLAKIHVPRGEKPTDTNGERATEGDEREAEAIVQEGQEDAAESDR